MRKGTIQGTAFIVVISIIAYLVAGMQALKTAGISPVIAAIIIGMLIGNIAGKQFPESWNTGFSFCQKRILRLAVILFGFRITFTQIGQIGAAGMTTDVVMLISTFAVGMIVGKLLKMDIDTSILCAAGSSICGAAAVMATEAVTKAEPHKTAAAVGTVVLFGTLAMFLYPFLFRISGMSGNEFGIYIGSTVHEVAQAVAAGEAVNTPETAVITKMGRVMLLVPFLVILSIFLNKKNTGSKVSVPWFAFMFLVVAAFNTVVHLPSNIITALNTADMFLLTCAMSALGIETRAEKLKNVGTAPFIVASVMFVWLIAGGYFINTFIFRLL